MKGKKLYKTSMITFFRLFLLAIALFFFHDLYLETFKDPRFISERTLTFIDVWSFHMTYPHELFSFLVFIGIPYIYYSFIRGTIFYDKGFSYNKGIPFLNVYVPYSDIKSYKLIHPETILAVRSHQGDIYVVTDNDLKRVIGILDQHNLPGDLASSEYLKMLQNMKHFFIVVTTFTGLIYLAKKIGLFQF